MFMLHFFPDKHVPEHRDNAYPGDAKTFKVVVSAHTRIQQKMWKSLIHYPERVKAASLQPLAAKCKTGTTKLGSMKLSQVK